MNDIPVERLVKHRRKMLLIERIISHTDLTIHAQATITPESTFLKGDHVPAWIGIEYAAQAVAALSGLRFLDQDEENKVGLLLSCRRYKCTRPRFMLGDILDIDAREEFNDGQMGAYNCTISIGKEEVATVSLSAYIPNDVHNLPTIAS